MKGFICSCGTRFEDETKLNLHILNHAEVFNHETIEKMETLHQSIVLAFPDFQFSIQSGEQMNARFFISLRKEHLYLEQRIGNIRKHQTVYPDTIEDGIRELREKLNIIQYIENKVADLNQFYSFYCVNFCYSYPINNSYFTFEFKVKEEDEKRQISFFPYQHTEENVMRFIDGLAMYYLEEIEGDVSFRSNGYYDEIYIGEFNFEEFARRKKPIRIEILE